MSHLTPSEFIDLAEGVLPADRAAHADRCDGCRAQAKIVGEALQLADGSNPVPEPSPLFWDQLSARVREAVAETPSRRMFGFASLPLARFAIHVRPMAAALAIGVLMFAAVLLLRAPRPFEGNAVVTSAPPAGEVVLPLEPTFDPAHAAEWAVLTAAAADLHLDEARDAGMAVGTATVDHAVSQLTRDELSELGRLLQSELKGSGN
jgi:hypothetical protein